MVAKILIFDHVVALLLGGFFELGAIFERLDAGFFATAIDFGEQLVFSGNRGDFGKFGSGIFGCLLLRFFDGKNDKLPNTYCRDDDKVEGKEHPKSDFPPVAKGEVVIVVAIGAGLFTITDTAMLH